jgi:hypothetical protein
LISLSFSAFFPNLRLPHLKVGHICSAFVSAADKVHAITGKPFLIGGTGISLGLFDVAPTINRHQLRCRGAILSRLDGPSLAQSVGRAMRQTGSIAPLPEAHPETGMCERAPLLRDEKRQVAG